MIPKALSVGTTNAKALLVILVVAITTEASAKDLFVSTTGDDSTSYASNDVAHPWRTVARAFAGALSGDTVFYRAGVFDIASAVDTRSAAPHTTHKNYDGESVQWTSSLTSYAITIEQDDTTIDGIDFASSTSDPDTGFFMVGYFRSATHFTLRNFTATLTPASDNSGIVYARDENANYITVENCKVTGGGAHAGSGNSSCVWLDRVQYATVQNCELTECQCGIYYKHSNQRTPASGPVIRNNYIHDCGRNLLLLTCNYGTIANNLLINGTIGTGVDGGTGSGGTGSDDNTYDHNTLINGRYDSWCPSRAGDPGATNNVWTNNLVIDKQWIEAESSCSETLNWSADYNLYAPGDVVQHRRVNYTLSSWRAVYDTDAHSVSGTPTFVGGAAPTTIAGYALASGSLGKNAASDGTDMGANLALVGWQPLEEPDTQAPSVPTSLHATAISPTSINLTWSLSTDDVAVAGYRVYRNDLAIGTTATASFSDTGLWASTAYAYRVAAYDAAHNESARCAEVVATTLAEDDVEPPSAPTQLTATVVSSSRIDLSWSAATDNIAVEGYRVLRDGAQIALVAADAFVDTGLTASTQYRYTVVAVDVAGNTSSESEAALATTLSAESAAVCGDHVRSGNEVCDDGVNDGSYGGCMPGCLALAPYCGDNGCDAGEDADVCPADCSCGDGSCARVAAVGGCSATPALELSMSLLTVLALMSRVRMRRGARAVTPGMGQPGASAIDGASQVALRAADYGLRTSKRAPRVASSGGGRTRTTHTRRMADAIS